MAVKARKKASLKEQLADMRAVWFLPGAALIFILASLMMFVTPQIDEIITSQEDIKTAQEELDRLITKRQSLESISEFELDEQLETARQALPDDKPLDATIIALAERLKASDVRLLQFELEPGVLGTGAAEFKESQVLEGAPGELSFLPIDFGIEGNPETVQRFFNALDMSLPLSSIGSIDFATQLPEGGNSILDAANLKHVAAVEVLVHYSLPIDTIGKPSDLLPELLPDDFNMLTKIDGMESTPSATTDPAILWQNDKQDLFIF